MPMARFGLHALMLVVALTMGCEANAHSPTPETTLLSSLTGVEGTTLVDEGCPVLPDDSPCPQRPLPARVLILNEKGVEVNRSNTNERGEFRIELSVGSYILQGQNLTGAPLPTATPVPVNVLKGQMQLVTIKFESGVRAPATP
jgi:hypothetical protein